MRTSIILSKDVLTGRAGLNILISYGFGLTNQKAVVAPYLFAQLNQISSSS